ncbi:hypothetical protein [Stigmatella aurantiaca]|uniref:Conserved uncharacterized protein n=1 Tax=Stigmatella aurantiaca (strain DW4/3-1) TaxID=378806 RepID=Q09CI0_STIAD|nr:hypothetical protein [Stigmatella aurantiaca]ADO69631.1 conserved uncharacterized protein [Stigmatella aurantiaca DW4/3-1]EAU69354.1 hypothetical protein STIAU_3657 [Stigmatella aurantiaca DW4/3-1]
MTPPVWLKTAAQRSGQQEGTLGHTFAQYQEMEERSAEALAAELGCTPETLQWLSLCRNPSGDRFAEHLFEISKRFAVDSQKLAAVVRRVEVMKALSMRNKDTGQPDGKAMLLAARDRLLKDEGES